MTDTRCPDGTLKEILANEVYPALGCTEPISCAYAAATAAAHLGAPVEHLVLEVDSGTYKNGAAVIVPCSQGATGNLIAAAMGAALARPEAKLELLREVTPEVLRQAGRLRDGGACEYRCLEGEIAFRVVATVRGGGHTARCVLAGGHTRLERIEVDGQAVLEATAADAGQRPALAAYREHIRRCDLRGLILLAEAIDDNDRAYLRRGVEMNLAMAERGASLRQTAYQLRRLRERGWLSEDIFFRTKVQVASAVDARMAGVEQAVMTSGGSGNQGIVAILTPYLVGRELGISEETLLRSVAVAHIVNAYVKCFVGELAAICGCAMAAGIAASAAIVYQQSGADMGRIALAANNVIGDLGGMICDGAKPGCAMKTISSVEAAMRSAFMALDGYGLAAEQGVLGQSAEDSIRNLARLTLEGMLQVDHTVLEILRDKAAARGNA